MKEVLDSDVLPWLIEMGLVDLAEIKAAADAAIAEEVVPSGLLIDLSLAKDLNEVLSLVRPEGVRRPTDRGTAALLRRFRTAIESGRLELGEGLRRYRNFASFNLDPSSDVWLSAVHGEDAYELAVQGIFGSVDDVQRELLDELEQLEAQLGS